MKFTDGRGITLSLARPPRRIVSLVPSTTESLLALGCGERVVGVTRFCVHPAGVAEGRVKVGGTKDLVLDRLEALQPDLVIGNVEENTPTMFSAIERRFPLYAAFPRTVDDAIVELGTLGALVGAEAAAERWMDRIAAARARLHAARRPGRLFAYLIWRAPWMAVSGDTFISAMLAEAGLLNALSGAETRYPVVEPSDLRGVDTVLLSSEPFPFSEKHRAELAGLAGIPDRRISLVDGELCSWHGVRMAAALDWLRVAAPRW
jgi:iron complex transport system substrate-binding protein